ncbi:unnamed protein product [Psylliodes chrysocephalus]|uniref:Uncharacterized protein n=1 Tax=Psylliodes chrysocephalus TaxID=3402493 RepID=A0A9P0GI79_9CUCU|nr:unnamed protein product [Psylliodes chrysocephala]
MRLLKSRILIVLCKNMGAQHSTSLFYCEARSVAKTKIQKKDCFLDKYFVKKEIKYRKVDANVPRKFSMVYNLPNGKIEWQPENILSDSQTKTRNTMVDLVNVDTVEYDSQQVNLLSTPKPKLDL